MSQLIALYASIIKKSVQWLYRFFIVNKMHSLLGGLLFLLVGAFIAFVDARMGFKISIVFFGLFAGLLVFLVCFIKPKYTYFISFTLPFIFFVLERKLNTNLPLGILVQTLSFMAVFIILAKKIANKDFSFSFFNNRVSYMIILLIVYTFIQGLNPNMHSYAGWGLVVKGSFGILAMYFSVMYFLHEDKKFLNQFINLWITLSTIAALYACYQQWFGMFEFEEKWIRAEELRFRRIFIKGSFRKFSLLSDPAAFGIFMAASSLLTIPLILRKASFLKKSLLLTCAVLMIMAVGYSGTRTAYAMIPAGLVIFALMTITNKRTLYLSAAGVALIGFVLFGPIHGNQTVHRVRTLINSDDPSLNVRDVNRGNIQKYIYDNPIGGGLMTTGTAGLKYNPEHDLAGFPPDSGYLKLALETGYVGLFIYSVFFFVCLQAGVSNYYRSNDEDEKVTILALVTFVFAICIALYAQSITGQVPMSMVFWPTMGILAALKPKQN